MDDDKKKIAGEEEEIVVANAEPIKNSNEPPIPPGHSRFYCSKCHTVRWEVKFGVDSSKANINLTLISSPRRSHMICQTGPQVGDVPTAWHSTQQHRENANGVRFCRCSDRKIMKQCQCLLYCLSEEAFQDIYLPVEIIYDKLIVGKESTQSTIPDLFLQTFCIILFCSHYFVSQFFILGGIGTRLVAVNCVQ